MEHENREIIAKKEALSANIAFRRFAGTFELYQQLLADADSERSSLIKDRMHKLHGNKKDLSDSEMSAEDLAKGKIMGKVLEEMLVRCEDNSFTPEVMVSSFFDYGLGDELLENYKSRVAGDKEMFGDQEVIFVNEVVYYEITKDNEIWVSVIAADLNTQTVFKKIKEGLRILSDEIKGGRIEGDQVVMKSWLLGGERADIAKLSLGKDLQINNVEFDDESIAGHQRIALLFNNRSLKEYLEDGKLPEVGEIIMSPEEFVSLMDKQ